MLHAPRRRVKNQAKEIEILLIARDELKHLIHNHQKNLEDLSNLLENVIKKFSDQEADIVHYQDTPEFAEFSKAAVDAISAKYNAKTNLPTLFHRTKGKNNQCVEASILQSIAQLRVPMTATTSVHHTTFQKSMTDFVKILLGRATDYFYNPRYSLQHHHLTLTLAALCSIDINQFNNAPQSSSTNPIDEFVTLTCGDMLGKLNSWPVNALIRALHSIIILSPAESGFKNYLSDEDAKEILEVIAGKLDTLNETDIHLAQQLFQIRNIYSAVFPVSLSEKIDPFLSAFNNKSSSKSNFERRVFTTLKHATRELARDYPGLIHERFFNPNNPISAALGLESDITYENPFIKTCIQVDGNKYHTYNGSKNTTQKTLLRDFCFQRDGWETIVFTDTQNNVETAKQRLMSAVIIPTYQNITQYHLDQVNHFIATSGIQEKLIQTRIENIDKINAFENKLFALSKEINNPTLDEFKAFYRNLQRALKSLEISKELFDEINEQLPGFDHCKAAEIMKNLSLMAQAQKAISDIEATLKVQAVYDPCELKKLEEVRQENESNLKKVSSQIKEAKAKLQRLQREANSLEKDRTLEQAKRSNPLLTRAGIKDRLESLKTEIPSANGDVFKLCATQKELQALKVELAEKLKQIKSNQTQSLDEESEFNKSLAENKAIVQECELALRSNILGAGIGYKIEKWRKHCHIARDLLELLPSLDQQLQKIVALRVQSSRLTPLSAAFTPKFRAQTASTASSPAVQTTSTIVDIDPHKLNSQKHGA